ncbi:hypothetical protein GHT06_009002 [Daphnia sinensis]|uniref:BPL/LPL catalytic domain-containing protein n=1 Tax=Daphnia sinensis TaxID=1820382 RepID=A0AAD5LNC3_9CRUS|nr:hypothetical protein GHT06_009002 [Daphnia sinensis]
MNVFRNSYLLLPYHRIKIRRLGNMNSYNPVSIIATRSITDDVSKKSVFVSKSTNIFENLALEDWFYKNFDFENQSLLFMWVNTPCVVIGRHQNPWLEVNLKNLSQNNVFLSRRNSGGGTVYHDQGNLNCSFFTSRVRYNRKSNLETICGSIRSHWNLNLTISPREDILFDSYKVSGTASKLGHRNAYHHCTLLVDVDSSLLHQMLNVHELGIQSNSTPSVRSPTMNLKACCPEISVDEVIHILGCYYIKNSPLCCQGFDFVTPSEENFPGLDLIKQSFSAWQWIYGKTPSFSVCCPIGDQSSEVKIQVLNGKIERLHFQDVTVGKQDALKLSTLLVNQKLDSELHDVISNGNVFGTMGEDRFSKLKEILLALCLTSV